MSSSPSSLAIILITFFLPMMIVDDEPDENKGEKSVFTVNEV